MVEWRGGEGWKGGREEKGRGGVEVWKKVEGRR